MRTRTIRLPSSLALMGIYWSCIYGGERIPVCIDDPAGLTEPWQITCGVPFPKGLVKDETNVRLVNGAGREVECQVDKTATWLDGSVRWVLLNFRGRTDMRYFVEYGADVRRSDVRRGIQVTERSGEILVQTGVAECTIVRTGALIDRMLVHGEAILSGAGSGAYVVDNRGRRAYLAGKAAEIVHRVLERGPLRAVIRSEGWYVVAGNDRERIARGIVWMYFYRDSACVKLVHRLVLTEDTNQVWFRDIGIELPTDLADADTATFDVSEGLGDETRQVILGRDDETWMAQEDYPHFMSKDSRFAIGHRAAGKETTVAAGRAAGEWCDLSGPNVGLTVMLRTFAEQFPTELTVRPKGITVHFWSGRGGKELDFRAATLARDYWGEWANYAPADKQKLAALASNAQSSAKTHEVLLFPHRGPLDAVAAERRVHAENKRIFAMADPAWVSASGALGIPFLEKDTKRFAEQEAFISDVFDRMVFPLGVFPMNGYIAWGCHPYLGYAKDKKTGKWYATWYRIRHLVEYHLRRYVWTMYARSGERKYIQYAERFNRFAGDMEMHHWDAGARIKGGFVDQGGTHGLHYPFYWGGRSEIQTFNGSGTDIHNYLLEFYFTGEWTVRELAEQFAEAFKKHYDLKTIIDYGRPFLTLRCMVAAYSIRWDPTLARMVKELADRIIAPDAKHGMGVWHPKVGCHTQALLDYWHFCGDDRARGAFLKFVDFQYKYQRDGIPLSYQNGAGGFYALAYRLTQRKEYLQLAKQSIEMARRSMPTTLKEDLAPGLDALRRLPHIGADKTLHPFFSTPIVLKLLSEERASVEPFPVLPKYYDSAKAWAAFEKPAGKPVSLDVTFKLMQQRELEVVVLGPEGRPVEDFAVLDKEIAPQSSSWSAGVYQYFARIQIPASHRPGVYYLALATTDEFRILKADVDRMVLVCPQGFWVGGSGLYREEDFLFHVPPGTKDVRLFLGRPIKVVRPDGNTAEDPQERQIGEVALPVDGEHGFWRLRFSEPGIVKFRNLEPIVCFGTPDRYFRPPTPDALKPKAPTLPRSDAVFVDGRIGQGIQLNGKDVLQFARGAKRPDDSYESFPGDKATIELWFRPNFSTDDFTFKGNSNRTISFLSAGTYRELTHYIASGPYTTKPYAYVYMKINRAPNRGDYGAHARKPFRAGEWTHIAATWEVTDKRAECFVFIDGMKRERMWLYPWPLPAPGRFRLHDIDEMIRIGPANGTFDELRVSDVVRYTADFTPLDVPFAVDSHTKALFHFDGSTEAVAAGGRRLGVEHRDAE